MLPSEKGCLAYIWIIILAVFHRGADCFNLTAPREYIVFTGDILVGFGLPIHVPLENMAVKLLSVVNRDSIISVALPHGRRTGTVSILCGKVDHAGLYIFELQNQHTGTVLTRSEVMTAKWPKIVFRLPPIHIALTGRVRLDFVSTQARCNYKSRRSKYWIDIVYLGKNPSGDSPWIKPVVVFKEQIYDLRTMDRRSVASFNCDVFDQAGHYRAIFRSTHNPTGAIAKSGRMSVQWRTQLYGLESRSGSIFPCREAYELQYKHPSCSGKKDKIRMYKIKREAVASVASPRKLEYVVEKTVDHVGSTGIMRYHCELFERDVPAYCFRYVSVSRTGGVKVQETICVASEEDIGTVINGGWNYWSAWSACSPKYGLCGKGRQNRYRLCNSPPPSGGGTYCDGETLAWQDCEVECRDKDKTGDQNSTGVETITESTMNEECKCGCNLTSSEAVFSTSGRCAQKVTWLIKVNKGRRVVLTFTLFDIDPDLQHLYVRDGVGDHMELLVKSTGHDRPRVVTSSRNVLHVELNTLEKGMVMGRGFQARYTIIVDNSTAEELKVTELLNPVESSGVDWKTPLVVIGVILCIIILACGVVYVLYYRRLRKEGKLYYPTSHSKGEIVQSASMQSGENTDQTPTFDVTVATAGGSTEVEADVQDNGKPHENGIADKMAAKKGKRVDKVRSVAGIEQDDEADEKRQRRKHRHKHRRSKIVEEEEDVPGGSPSLHPLIGKGRELTTSIEDTSFIDDHPDKSTIKRAALKRGSADRLDADTTDLLTGKRRVKGSVTPSNMSPKSQRSISRSLKSLKSLSQSTKSLRDALKPLSLKTSQRPNPDGQSPDARSMRDMSPTTPSDANDFTPLMTRKKRAASKSNLSRASSRTSGFSVAFDGFEFDDTIHYEPGSYFQSDDLFLDPCELDWTGGTVKHRPGEADPDAQAALDEKLKAFQMNI